MEARAHDAQLGEVVEEPLLPAGRRLRAGARVRVRTGVRVRVRAEFRVRVRLRVRGRVRVRVRAPLPPLALGVVSDRVLHLGEQVVADRADEAAQVVLDLARELERRAERDLLALVGDELDDGGLG